MSGKIKTIGLALIAVCAFGAVSAGASQAAAPNWKITGLNFTGTETIKAVNVGVLKLTVPAIGLTIECQKLAAPGTEIFGENKSSAGSLTFSECIVPGLPDCDLYSFSNPIGTIETVAVKSELKTVGGLVYDIVTPAFGSGFVSILVQNTSTCPLPAILKLSGSLALLKPSLGETVGLASTASEPIQKASGATLVLGANPAYLDGALNSTLAGVHIGTPWGLNP